MTFPVVVTGGCGFIGREVSTQLVALGHEVTVIDDLSKDASTAPPGVNFVRLDLTDSAATLDALKGFKHCVHLAAKIGGIGYFHKYPATILAENDRMYASVFGACATHDYTRIVYVSSSMVFESATVFPSKESDLPTTPVPCSAYGFSKLSGEWYCRSFLREHGLPYTIIRPFNAYGVNEAPGDEIGEAHVIPDLAWKLLGGQSPLELLGDGLQTRCYTHVSDIARGICLALNSEKAINEDFNTSTGEETSVLELAAEVWKLIRPESEPTYTHVDAFKHDVRRRVPDVTKARDVLGFEAQVSLTSGLPPVIDWLRERYATHGPK
jgi:UDP-glucose 4-epimerase